MTRFDYRFVISGAMLVYGIYSLKQGIRTRKTSDVAIGVACLLGFVALVCLRFTQGCR